MPDPSPVTVPAMGLFFSPSGNTGRQVGFLHGGENRLLPPWQIEPPASVLGVARLAGYIATHRPPPSGARTLLYPNLLFLLRNDAPAPTIATIATFGTAYPLRPTGPHQTRHSRPDSPPPPAHASVLDGPRPSRAIRLWSLLDASVCHMIYADFKCWSAALNPRRHKQRG